MTAPEPPPDTSWIEMEPHNPPGPIRRALHRHWEARRYAREMRAKHAEVLAAMAEVGILRETVEQRLQRALDELDQTLAFIDRRGLRDDYEVEAAVRRRADVDRARGN